MEISNRIPCVCQIRTANIIYNGYTIGAISEEQNDACESDWVIKINWDTWHKSGEPNISGIDTNLKLKKYISLKVPDFVRQRTLPDESVNLYERLEELNLTWNDRFEYMCVTHGACIQDNITIERQ